MQINEAMFVGSPGWVLKPKYLRRGFDTAAVKQNGKERLVVNIIGASSCQCIEFPVTMIPPLMENTYSTSTEWAARKDFFHIHKGSAVP